MRFSLHNFCDNCERILKKEENFIMERLQIFNAVDSDEGSVIFARMKGQTAFCAQTLAIKRCSQ